MPYIFHLGSLGGTKPIAEFGSSVDDSNYVKITGKAIQNIAGNLIRPDSEDSFDYLQLRQYATKYSINGAFVKKTGKNLQVIEGYLRKGNYVTSNSAAAQQFQAQKLLLEMLLPLHLQNLVEQISRYY
ncbi:MAG: hypothetical protein EZS28_053191 [Streblomastix strix]|uniref:Uncharacterized protein n=1 Tax=Streblomastix strix TaxID=222440 RepID=A0A5J4RIA7_9EUKA|nr:MAG: hypothetical protein EZS28_053191 [Streblomastix strix]